MFDNKEKLKDQKTHKTQGNSPRTMTVHPGQNRRVKVKAGQQEHTTLEQNYFELFIIIIIIIVNYFLLFDVGSTETPKSQANVQSIN